MRGCFLLRAGTTQSRFQFGAKSRAGPEYKTRFPGGFFIPGFHCQMQNNKTQRGGARSAPPLWGGAKGAAEGAAKWKTTRRRLRRRPKGAARFARRPFGFLLFSIWQWKPRIKNLMEISFLFRSGPTFAPKLRCWPLIKTLPGRVF